MNIRTIVVTGLCLSLLTVGCASTVDGQAQIASGAVLPTTSSAPSPFPDPSTSGTTGDDSTAATTVSTQDTASPESTESTESTESESTRVTDNTPSSTDADDSSVFPSSVTSIPGLSKDCNAVLAGITAFGKVLQGAGATEKISQATVDEALGQLPASGLPAQPQADVTVLRTAVAGSAGKTLSEFGVTLAQSQVVDALQDLSSWFQDNCS